MKSIFHVGIIVCAALLLAGCLSLKKARTVTGNTWCSNFDPSLCLEVEPGLAYIGEVTYGERGSGEQYDLGWDEENEIFLFGKADERSRLARCLAVWINTLSPISQFSYRAESYEDGPETVETGTTRIDGKLFQYCTMPQAPMYGNEEVEKFLAEKGLVLPNAAMTKRWRAPLGADRKTLVLFIYWEILPRGIERRSQWSDVDLTARQNEYVEAFLQGADNSFTLTDYEKPMSAEAPESGTGTGGAQ